MTDKQALAETIRNYLESGVDLLLTDEDYKTIVKALEQEPCDHYTEGYFKGYGDGQKEKLEQEPCECIDRAAAMTEIMISKRIALFDGEYWIKTKDATQIIRELPCKESEVQDADSD